MNSTKKLAAIMFTDLVGYTSMMGKDEEKALRLLHRNKHIHINCIEKYKGTLVKEMGDGIMAHFVQSKDAVLCAIEIQEMMYHEPEIQVRIGIHFGKVMFENRDIFGDGVNIASRIESLADPDGIYVSKTVAKDPSVDSDIQTSYVGKAKLKNVKDPVEVYAIQGGNLPSPSIQRFNALARYRKIPLKPSTIALVVAIPLSMILLLVSFFNKRAKINQAVASLDEIESLVNSNWRDFTEPYRQATEIEQVIPNHPKLQNLIAKSSVKINVTSYPDGAEVYIKEYMHPDGEWEFIGSTPIAKTRLPKGLLRWKLVKSDYDTLYAIAFSYGQDRKIGESPQKTLREKLDVSDLHPPKDFHRTLVKKGSAPERMTLIEGNQMPYGKIEDFFIDIYEVTNKQYKVFIERGGYETPLFWKFNFMLNGHKIAWEQAMTMFVDQTGESGPATWKYGNYPDGEDNFPVGGISWYEAAAYAEYMGKSLPTRDHWGLARGESKLVIQTPHFGGFALFLPFTNFGTEGPVEVGSQNGITSFGAHDMAGNVREWCYNDTPQGKLLRGGAWNTNAYAFHNPAQAKPMDRSSNNGFRCVFYPRKETIPDLAFSPVTFSRPFEIPEFIEPVSDEAFAIFKSLYAYDNVDLNEKIEETKETEYWDYEKVSFDAVYSNETIFAHLFIPKNTLPPYQTVVYVPGSASFNMATSDRMEEYYEFPVFLDFIVKSGRAVVFPIYKGTFERNLGMNFGIHGPNFSHQFAEFIIQIAKDFQRTMDYLETREDIDKDKIGLYGMSWGTFPIPIMSAIDSRVKLNIMVAAHLNSNARDEVNTVHFASRIKTPTLIINGAYDSILPPEIGGVQFFKCLSSLDKDKKLFLSESDHIPRREDLLRETLGWLDTYFGSAIK